MRKGGRRGGHIIEGVETMTSRGRGNEIATLLDDFDITGVGGSWSFEI